MNDEFRYLAIGGSVKKIKNGSFVLNCKILDAEYGLETYKKCLMCYDKGEVSELDRELLVKHQPHFLIEKDRIDDLERIVSDFVLGKRTHDCVWVDGINLGDVRGTVEYIEELKKGIDPAKFYVVSIVDLDLKGDY